MDCSRIGERIDAWLDGELSERERREVAGHLEACARCHAEYGALVAAVARLESLTEPEAPEDFVAAVMARLPERRPVTSPARVAWVLGLAGALGTAATVLVVLWLTGQVAMWGGLMAAASALPGLAMSLARAAVVLGEALAGPATRALALNVALLAALALAYRWRSRIAQSAVYVAV